MDNDMSWSIPSMDLDVYNTAAPFPSGLYDMSDNYDLESLLNGSSGTDQVFTYKEDPTSATTSPLQNQRGDESCRPGSVSSATWHTSEASPLGFFDSETEADGKKLNAEQQLGSPGSASETSGDLPFSPLSTGAEATMWSREQTRSPGPGLVENIHQGAERSPPIASPIETQRVLCRVVVNSVPVGTRSPSGGQNWSSASASTPSPQANIAAMESSGGEGVSSSPQANIAAMESSTSEGEGVSPQRQRSSGRSQQVKVTQDNIKTLELIMKGVKRKAEVIEEEEEEVAQISGEGKISRSEKNAMAARENRLKKKRELEDLKSRSVALETENKTLRKANSEQLEKIGSLEKELEYCKSVLFNDSALAGFLSRMNPIPNVKLSSSFGTPSSRKANASRPGGSGGVCLHVGGNCRDATFEMCSNCARNAQATFDS